VTTAARVLDVARTQLGTVQAADGSNPYGRAYGMDKVAWCAQFVWWCFQQAGAGTLIPKSAYTPTLAGWYQQRGQATRLPRVGSLVFFDWPGDGVDRISHVGLVEAVNSDGTITTIEGNTSSGTAGSQRMGGGVWRRRRSTSAVIVYGHPAYAGAPPLPRPAEPAAAMATLQYGMRSDSRVVALQRWLNAYAWKPALPLLPPTGNYLEQTVAVVKAAQAQCGITGADADGRIVGPKTRAAFAARGARW
jgi:CHAP domain/Putative peptidoglycan binding domain